MTTATAQLEGSASESNPARPRPRRRWRGAFRALVLLVAAGSVFGGLLAVGMMPRARQAAALEVIAKEIRTGAPRVRVSIPKRAEAANELILPGDVTAFRETSIHARTNGYLRDHLVDIGDRVTAKQVLATIDTPELDQELHQARAQLQQSKAERTLAVSKKELARVMRNRSLALYNQNASTRQEQDEVDAGLRVAEAAVEAAGADVSAKEANVRRLEELQSFQKVEAPFDGVITARNVNAGALIDDSGSSMGRELFRIVQTKTLRVFVYVPQLEAPEIHLGQEAQLLVREFPDRTFVGKVARTAGAIDPSSRTLLTEIHVDNADDRLYAGMYVKVRFQLKRARQPMMVPATTLVVNAQGTRVAVVRTDGTIHYQGIELGRDLGPEVEVLSGLEGNESLVENPVESLTEGRKVEVISDPPAEGKVALGSAPAAPKVAR